VTRTTPPFRADHVGSLLRPSELLEAREAFDAGRIHGAELRAAEDEAIREVVELQRAAGLQSATDGEFRRTTWRMDFIYQLGGIEHAPGDSKVQLRNEQGTVAVRLLLDRRRQRPDPRAGDRKAPADRRNRNRGWGD
jgi:methionine synthase II (cobalamin-independent)